MQVLAIIGAISILLFVLWIFGSIAGWFQSFGHNKNNSQTVTFQQLVPVCSQGIYALCFAEGYVILTESLAEARAVCADLELDLNPYWSEIVQYYPNRAEVLACMKELESYIGESVSSFATVNPDGLSIKFQGYISTLGV